ncbi:hypothetical protein MPSEU_000297500 [Mayamaea pseudoterrestris]|nr:hypothetical protein MPSEU_000297500 [Mayamaea pseudoterrestris]
MQRATLQAANNASARLLRKVSPCDVCRPVSLRLLSSASTSRRKNRERSAQHQQQATRAQKPQKQKLQGKKQILEALQQHSLSRNSSISDNRQSFSPRALAASNLVYLLNADSSWRNDVIFALEPDESSQEEYMSFYSDCLPSFQEVFKTNQKLQDVMERLLPTGFGKAKFARQYQRTLQYTKKHETLMQQMATRQSEVAYHESQVQTLQDELVGLKEELDELIKTDNQQPEQQPDSSLLDNTVQYVSSIFKSGQEKEKRVALEALAHSRRERLIELTKMVREKERLLQHNNALALSAGYYMENIQRDIDHTLRHVPFTKEEIQPATMVLDECRPVIVEALAEHVRTRHAQMVEQFQELDDNTDLTKPHEWYSYARLDRRKIIYHGGPTNSGKTYQALERLKEAKKGMYLGPLRLLAVEVFEKLTAAGVYCSLYTGQEILRVPFETHGAATVEMADLTVDYDVVVIDEIQMMSDNHRGFAWTRALLGSRCKEIHVCGGLEAKDLVERIVANCGDEFEFRSYERFTELTVADRSLASSSEEVGSYKTVQPGDCVVAFSRNDLFAIKREIETQTSHKCCVVYGSLPPLTRTEQARRFNDPDSGYDVLVASDAIGMGLNLNIRRIIFNSMYKQDGSGITQLDHSAVKQISGRAGRRNSPFPEGVVTCRSPDDMAHLRKCMSTPVSPIQSAGLVPTAGHVELFHQTVSSYGLSKRVSSLHNIMGHFSDMAKLKSGYFLCRQTAMMIVAKQLEKFNLSIRDKYNLCMSPIVESSKESMDVLKKFAAKLASREVPGLPQNLRPKPPKTFEDLSRLCSIYSHLELFLWLQNKFPPVNLMEQQAALSRKERTMELIGEGLMLSDKLKLDHSYIKRDLMLRSVSTASELKTKAKKEVDDPDKWMVEDV